MLTYFGIVFSRYRYPDVEVAYFGWRFLPGTKILLAAEAGCLFAVSHGTQYQVCGKMCGLPFPCSLSSAALLTLSDLTLSTPINSWFLLPIVPILLFKRSFKLKGTHHARLFFHMRVVKQSQSTASIPFPARESQKI